MAAMTGNKLHPVGNHRRNAKADVIFIHGLDGDSHKTWTTERNVADGFWPAWLAEERPQINIWSLTWPSASNAWFGKGMDILSAATSLLDLLPQSKIGERPIIFVVHSLGGLVAKQMLRTAREAHNKEWTQVLENTRGIVFLATPHSGAALANFLVTLGEALGVFGWFFRRQRTIDNLEADNPQLAGLNDWYRDNSARIGVTTKVYREDVPIRGIMIVNETSSNPGLTDVRPIPIPRDHITICKPLDKEDQVYRGVRKFIDDWLQQNSRPAHQKMPNSPVQGLSAATPASDTRPISDTSNLPEPASEVAPVPAVPSRKEKRALGELIDQFLSDDPADAQHAIPELVDLGATVLSDILGKASNSHRQLVLLRMLCEAMGPPSIPVLVDAIVNGGWSQKLAAAPCFAVFRNNQDAERLLYEMLKNTDFDVRRLTIEAIGYAGYEGVRWEIVRLAKYDDLNKDHFQISEYVFGKLSYYVIGALVRCFGLSGKEAELSFLEEFLDLCSERNVAIFHAVNDAVQDITPNVADAIQRKWLNHSNITYRSLGLRMLEHLRMQRTLPALLRIVDDEREDAEIRRSADICISNIATPEAAEKLSTFLSERKVLPSVKWAVSTLYAQPGDYPMPSGILDMISYERDEPYQQLLLAHGWRANFDYQDEMVAGLDHEHSFYVRGTSALSLAHLCGLDACVRLKSRLNEATEILEQVFILAALIHAGDISMVEALHRRLQDLELFHLLRPIWRREILAAFLCVEGKSPRARIWATIAYENLDSVEAEFNAKCQFFNR